MVKPKIRDTARRRDLFIQNIRGSLCAAGAIVIDIELDPVGEDGKKAVTEITPLVD